MAKLIKKKYYKANGESEINNFFVYISKEVVKEAEFDENEQVKVYAKDGKIIIEKEG